jgi:putative endonuclease
LPLKNYYWIYILECENGCYYTGYTKDLSRRFKQHVSGTSGSKYTRSFKPIRIAQAWEIFESVGTTLKIEQFIKRQSRKFKHNIVEQPKELKYITSKRLDMELEIIPVDPKKIHEDNKK